MVKPCEARFLKQKSSRPELVRPCQFGLNRLEPSPQSVPFDPYCRRLRASQRSLITLDLKKHSNVSSCRPMPTGTDPLRGGRRGRWSALK